MDVGLHHRGVDAHAAAFSQAMALCHGHHPDVDLFDHVCPQCHAPAPHGLGVRGLAGAHAGEVAVHQIGPHLAFQHLIAPVADVLEEQQAQHHFRRGALPAAALALGMALAQSFVHSRHQRLIRQHPIGLCHPVFAQVFDLSSDQAIAEATLRASHLNHVLCSGTSRSPYPDAAGHD